MSQWFRAGFGVAVPTAPVMSLWPSRPNDHGASMACGVCGCFREISPLRGQPWLADTPILGSERADGGLRRS